MATSHIPRSMIVILFLLTTLVVLYAITVGITRVPWWIRAAYAIGLQTWLTLIAAQAFSITHVSDDSNIIAGFNNWILITNLWLSLTPTLGYEVIFFFVCNTLLYLFSTYFYWIALQAPSPLLQRWVIGWYGIPIFTLALIFTFLNAPAIILGMTLSLIGIIFATTLPQKNNHECVIDFKEKSA